MGNPFIFGSSGATNLTNTIVAGSGDGSASTTTATIRAPAVTGTNAAGSDLVIQSGNGTGSGGSGNIILQTSPPLVVSPVISNAVQTFNNNGSSQTQSYTVASGSNQVLVVGIDQQSTTALTSVTYGGTSLTQLSSVAGSANRVDLWYMLAPPTGTANVVVTFPGFANASVHIYTITNVSQSSPFGTPASTTISGTTTISVAPTTTATQVVIDIVGAYGFGAATPTASQTQIQANTTGSAIYTTESYKAGSAGTTTMSYSWASSSNSGVLIAVGVNPPPSTTSDVFAEAVRVSQYGAIGLSGANYGASGNALLSQGPSLPPVWGSAGSTNGVKNYLGYTNGTNNNGSFETGALSGWSLGSASLTNALPSGTPTFGSGASGQLSASVVSSGALAGSYSLSLVSSAATTVGNFLASPSFTIDLEMQAKVLTFGFYYSATVGATNCNFSGTSSNSFGVGVYDVTNAQWVPQTANFGMTQSSGVGYCTGTFQTSASGTQYRLVVYNANATANAATILFDDFSVSPQTAPVGAVVTDWQSYVPTTAGLGTPTIAEAYWKRIGDSIMLKGRLTSGTTTASNIQINLPSGLTIDSAFETSTAVAGSLAVGAGGTGVSVPIVTGGATGFNIGGQSGGTALTPGAGTAYGASGVVFSWNVGPVKVTGWAGTVQMSSDTDTRVIAAFANTLSSTTATSGTGLIFTTVSADSAGSYSSVNGKYTCSTSGYYLVTAFVPAISSGSATIFVSQNAAAYSNAARLMDVDTTKGFSGSVLMKANAGDTLTVMPNASFTFNNTQGNVSFQRLSGPSVIAQSESVNARATNTAGTAITGTSTVVPFATIDYSSHGSLSTAGVFTVSVSGKYRVTALITVITSSNTLALDLWKNGSLFSNLGVQTSSAAALRAQGSDTVNCLAGDTLSVAAAITTSSTSLGTSTGQNHISIERVGN